MRDQMIIPGLALYQTLKELPASQEDCLTLSQVPCGSRPLILLGEQRMQKTDPNI